MFNEAARKFFDKFQLGKVYYISKGSLKVANKQYKTVQNDYEMTLNESSEVDEVSNEEAFVPETKFNFIPIEMLGPYVNSKELVGKWLLPQSVFRWVVSYLFVIHCCLISQMLLELLKVCLRQ
jgi:replication factor A1